VFGASLNSTLSTLLGPRPGPFELLIDGGIRAFKAVRPQLVHLSSAGYVRGGTGASSIQGYLVPYQGAACRTTAGDVHAMLFHTLAELSAMPSLVMTLRGGRRTSPLCSSTQVRDQRAFKWQAREWQSTEGFGDKKMFGKAPYGVILQ
jgi:hypothetical protein